MTCTWGEGDTQMGEGEIANDLLIIKSHQRALADTTTAGTCRILTVNQFL